VIGFLQRGAGYGSQVRPAGPPDLKIGRLRMVAIAPEMLAAEHDSNGVELARMLKARVTHEWPPVDWDPHVYRIILKQYDEWPASYGWHRYVVLERGLGRSRTLVGAVGGFPRAHGDVEIGYSTLPAFQRRGYATAFATKLVEWLLTRDEVQSVSAQAYPRVTESIKVMERCGMGFAGGGDEVGTVRYRRMRSLLQE
jgi:ribosomal-protein-alanine N-acetyltransferase